MDLCNQTGEDHTQQTNGNQEPHPAGTDADADLAIMGSIWIPVLAAIWRFVHPDVVTGAIPLLPVGETINTFNSVPEVALLGSAFDLSGFCWHKTSLLMQIVSLRT